MGNISDLFSDLVEKSTGVFIGEEHGDMSHTKLIQELSVNFNNHGITTFYFELIPVSENWRLEAWQINDDIAPLEEWFESQTIEYAQGMWDNYKALLIHLNDLGVRIIGIDDRDPDRGYKTNKFWADTIREDQARNPGKYIAYGGRAHTRSDDCEYQETIQEELNIPALFLMKGQHEAVRRRRECEDVYVVKLPQIQEQTEILR